MKLKRIILLVLALLGLSQLWMLNTASAASSSLPNYRSLFRQTTTQLGTAQRTLLKLDSSVRVLGYNFHKARTTSGLYDLIFEARELLQSCVDTLSEACTTPGRPYEIRKLLLKALEGKATSIEQNLLAIEKRYAKFYDGLLRTSQRLNTLHEAGAASDSDTAYMRQKYYACNQEALSLQQELLKILPYLEDGDAREDSAEDADDVMDFINLALQGLRFGESAAVIDDALEEALVRVDSAMAIQAALVEKTAECRGLLVEILSIVRELWRHCAIHCSREPNENSEPTTISEAQELFGNPLNYHIRAQVFTLQGALVVENSITNEILVLDSLSLPNGIYLVVFTSQSSSGKILRKTFRKIVIQH
jgi:hypothetical protein